jgi:hypothetical protein
MATHLYCLLTPPRPDAVPAGLSGVGGAPVRSLVSGAIETWVSEAMPRVPTASVDARQQLVANAMEHNAVVDAALATDRTPIPARLGQHFEDDATLLREVERHSSRLRELLARIAGSVEMGVIIAPTLRRALSDLQPVTPSMLDAAERGAGLRYLERVRGRLAATERAGNARDSLAIRVSDAVAALVQAEHRIDPRAEGHGGGTFSLAHLVNRSRVEEYRSAVAAVPPDREWRLLVTGPHAPYSFCAATGGTGGMILAG